MQYRRTTNSLGGATRIADPGADELARMLALGLQQQQQAQQNAQAQARMSLEERLAGEQMRREDARLAAQQQQAAAQQGLAERGFGLDERRFGEQVRQAGVGERMGERKLTLEEQVARAREAIEREDLGFRRETVAGEREDRGLERTQRGELARDELKSRERLSENDLAARAMERKARERESALDRTAATGRVVLDDQFARGREATAATRQQQMFDQNRALETEAREREQGREAALAGAQSVLGLDFQVPDPGMWTGPYYNARNDLPGVVQAIDAAFGVPTTEAEVLENARAIEEALKLRFAREANQQRATRGIDNSGDQAVLLALALDELQATTSLHLERVRGAPGPEAPNARRDPSRPKPAR
jgi:hypothetical protein